eukprot:1378814-Rhodomonas_salina.5
MIWISHTATSKCSAALALLVVAGLSTVCCQEGDLEIERFCLFHDDCSPTQYVNTSSCDLIVTAPSFLILKRREDMAFRCIPDDCACLPSGFVVSPHACPWKVSNCHVGDALAAAIAFVTPKHPMENAQTNVPSSQHGSHRFKECLQWSMHRARRRQRISSLGTVCNCGMSKAASSRPTSCGSPQKGEPPLRVQAKPLLSL